MERSLWLVLAAVIIAVAGQLSLKVGMDQVGKIGGESLSHPTQTLVRVFSTPLVLMGLSLYVVAALAWLIVLSRLDLSYAYPMLALMYVLIPLASRFLLREQIPGLRWLGILVVSLGLIIVSRT